MENTDIPTGATPAGTATTTTGSGTTGEFGPSSASFDVPPAVAPVPVPRFALRRSRTDRMLGGVCGGLAASLGTDAALLRVLTVALTLITGGAAAVVYVAAWMLAPEEDRPAY